MSDLKNILPTNNGIDEALLRAYLNGELTEAENKNIEKALSADEFAEDALEGLLHTNKTNYGGLETELKIGLQQTLKNNQKTKKKKQPLKSFKQLNLGIAITIGILVLVCLVWVLTHMKTQ